MWMARAPCRILFPGRSDEGRRGGLCPSAPPGTVVPGPILRSQKLTTANHVPVKRRATDIVHGQVGEYAACRMQGIRGNEKRHRRGKCWHFPSRCFFVAIVPVEQLASVLQAACAKAPVRLRKCVAYRSPEEELLWRRGTGAAKAPARSNRCSAFDIPGAICRRCVKIGG